MKAIVKRTVAVCGLAAVAYGTLIIMGAISAWNFAGVPGAALTMLGGAVGLMIGGAWEW